MLARTEDQDKDAQTTDPAQLAGYRGAERIRTVCRVVQVCSVSDRGLCLVQNLSDHGALIETGLELSVGENIKLALSGPDFLRGRVAWRAGKKVGIRFLTPIDCCALLRRIAEDHWSGKSRAPRIVLHRRATLNAASGALHATLHDISQHGARISCPSGLQPGDAVGARLEDGLEVAGVVRWTRHGQAGIQLSRTLTIEQLGSVARL